MSAEHDLREFARASLTRWAEDVAWRCDAADLPSERYAAIIIIACARFATHVMAEISAATPDEWGHVMREMMQQELGDSPTSAARRRKHVSKEGK